MPIFYFLGTLSSASVWSFFQPLPRAVVALPCSGQFVTRQGPMGGAAAMFLFKILLFIMIFTQCCCPLPRRSLGPVCEALFLKVLACVPFFFPVVFIICRKNTPQHPSPNSPAYFEAACFCLCGHTGGHPAPSQSKQLTVAVAWLLTSILGSWTCSLECILARRAMCFPVAENGMLG